MERRDDFVRDDDNGDNNNDGDGRIENEVSYEPLHVDEERGNSTFEDSKSVVSPANVLKTLFFICVWYTFSLFLTL